MRECYGKTGNVDVSDEWKEEDLRDISNASMNYADEFDELVMEGEK